MRDIMQGGEENPKAPMGNNCRPTLAVNNRPVRTNINFHNPVLSSNLTINYEFALLRHPRPSSDIFTPLRGVKPPPTSWETTPP